MKRFLALLSILVVGATIVLVCLVGRGAPSEVGPTARAIRPSSIVGSRTTPVDRRVEVAAGEPIAPGLPSWTTVLPTLPATAPQADSTPPPVPAEALVRARRR